MEEAHLIIRLAELLGIHALPALAALALIAALWRRNLTLQRKLFKLAHAQVLALAKLESTLETTTLALREASRARAREQPRARTDDNSPDFDT